MDEGWRRTDLLVGGHAVLKRCASEHGTIDTLGGRHPAGSARAGLGFSVYWPAARRRRNDRGNCAGAVSSGTVFSRRFCLFLSVVLHPLTRSLEPAWTFALHVCGRPRS